MSDAQLPLDLGHVTALAEGDFLVAACNAEAHAWLKRWPDWPGPASVITGPPGSGKTHLAHLFAAASGAALVAAAGLGVGDPPRLLAGGKALVVEDCDGGGLDETALFHLINLTKETGRFLLLTATQPPRRWGVALPDLSSRLLAMPVLAIGAPDDSVLAAVLVKLFADRQVRVGEDLVSYLLGRMERSFAAARALVDRLDRAALAGHRPVTVPLARAVLDGEGE